MNVLLSKSLKTLAAFAFATASISNFAFCAFFIHQPKVPESVRQLRKAKTRVE